MSYGPYYIKLSNEQYDAIERYDVMFWDNHSFDDRSVFRNLPKGTAKDLAFILNEARETRRIQAEAGQP